MFLVEKIWNIFLFFCQYMDISELLQHLTGEQLVVLMDLRNSVKVLLSKHLALKKKKNPTKQKFLSF